MAENCFGWKFRARMHQVAKKNSYKSLAKKNHTYPVQLSVTRVIVYPVQLSVTRVIGPVTR
jgi:hypothetical protein